MKTYKPMTAPPLILIHPASNKGGTDTMDDFESWLEHEFPAHSVYDFDSMGEYETWKNNLRLAFEAGWSSGKADVKGEPVRWWEN